MTQSTVHDLETLATHLRQLPGVVAVDAIDHDPRVDAPCLECQVGPDYDRVPPRVLRTIAAHDCGLESVRYRAASACYTVIVI